MNGLDRLEATDRAPTDGALSETLHDLKADAVLPIWQKALARRRSDPEGALTSDRLLLESVCKHIRHDMGVAYPADAGLPKHRRRCAEKLNLAPELHREVAFKISLEGCQTVALCLGPIRNRSGDTR
jgi:hypothetical protein